MKENSLREQPNLMDKIVSLCKRRGFIFPSSEIYSGFFSCYDYGPLGVKLKNMAGESRHILLSVLINLFLFAFSQYAKSLSEL